MTIVETASLSDDPSIWRRRFPFNELGNRRFMYNPDSDQMILGGAKRRGQFGSHAEDFHAATGSNQGYDDFYMRGWVGKGGQFRNGVIHFAPPLSKKWLSNPDFFTDAYKCLDFFLHSGATPATVLRGFGDTWEQPMSAIVG